jgi:hypothetical protein
VTALLAAGGCSSEQSVWRQYFQLIRQGVSGGFGSSTVSRDQAASIPYASLGYRVDGGGQALLVLATDTNGEQLWTAASHVVLLTRDGRILRSVGLPHNRTMMPQAGAVLPSLHDALKAPVRSTRLVDWPDLGTYSVPLSCLATARGSQLISILGTNLVTTRVDETCQSANPRWSFTDNYWLDADTGFVWRSTQHLHPAGSTVQIDILRPPG